mmetsp:Transcript_4713/g.12609  ORF Transcript_4713/g.12609 Transcript_4713/m.12609 type:complete len:250 (-) Transcript_4713:988-1737(-)
MLIWLIIWLMLWQLLVHPTTMVHRMVHGWRRWHRHVWGPVHRRGNHMRHRQLDRGRGRHGWHRWHGRWWTGSGQHLAEQPVEGVGPSWRGRWGRLVWESEGVGGEWVAGLRWDVCGGGMLGAVLLPGGGLLLLQLSDVVPVLLWDGPLAHHVANESEEHTPGGPPLVLPVVGQLTTVSLYLECLLQDFLCTLHAEPDDRPHHLTALRLLEYVDDLLDVGAHLIRQAVHASEVRFLLLSLHHPHNGRSAR